MLSLVHSLGAAGVLPPREERTYVDLAANDAQIGSNTYLMDKCLAWRGVCVEPNAKYHGRLRSSRSCALVDTCVSDEVRTVDFENAFYLGHIIDGRRLETTRMTCATLRGILALAAMRRVTYLSLDVEGHELAALRGVDWNATTVDALTLENADEGHVPPRRPCAVVAFRRASNQRVTRAGRVPRRRRPHALPLPGRRHALPAEAAPRRGGSC